MKNVKYSLAIFDMDGTILNTLEDLHDSVNYILGLYEFPKVTINDTRNNVGNGVRLLLKRSAPEWVDESTLDKMFEDFSAYYRKHSDIKTRPYNGIADTIRELRAAGVKTAVVSNKIDSAVQDLVVRYFYGLFDYALGEVEGIARKPEPDMVYRTLDELKIDKTEAVYIGDSDVDIETAFNSGLDCIAVTWGFRDRDLLIKKGASAFADTPEDLTKYII